MNWRRKLQTAVYLLLAAWLIGAPIYFLISGERVLDALLMPLFGVGFLWAIYMAGLFVGMPVAQIFKSVKNPHPARRTVDQIVGWVGIFAGCTLVWWSFDNHDDQPLLLGIFLIVGGAAFLAGAWRTDQF